ncbi:uncharacterized protein B0T23DRAFT_284660, partial [Neurospora hispaniola]
RYIYFDPNVLRKYILKDSKLPPSEVKCKSFDPNNFVGLNYYKAASYIIDNNKDNKEFDFSNLSPKEIYK